MHFYNQAFEGAIQFWKLRLKEWSAQKKQDPSTFEIQSPILACSG